MVGVLGGSVQSRRVPGCACLDSRLGRANVSGGDRIGTVIRPKRFTASASACGPGL